MDNQAIVELKNVFFSYEDSPVLEDVNLSIYERDFLGIIGPNGGGKTTLLRIILGLLKPDIGIVKVFSKSPKEGRRSIGYIPQSLNYDYDFPMSVMEVVMMGRLGRKGLWRRYTGRDRQLCAEALDKVGMAQFRGRQIGNLSGGQRQRVFIARALATEPQMLLLDEPVSSLDATWQESFYEMLRDLNSKLAIVLVTHDVSVVSMYIDKIACVNGRLYYYGSTRDGVEKISGMYECPVKLLVHGVSHDSIPHKLIEGKDDV
jgi:zinc transport system ATP-binding protein